MKLYIYAGKTSIWERTIEPGDDWELDQAMLDYMASIHEVVRVVILTDSLKPL